ncbi:MAG: hypothetical protein EU530_01625 [Promethearchaeota archaeon]|nr:MAG: hypothetical protein EU530_01625 [Candidatus Lokiarchaeota archaeon]
MGLSKTDQQLLDTFLQEILLDQRIIGVFRFGSSVTNNSYNDIDIALITEPIFSSQAKFDMKLQSPDRIDVSFLEDFPLDIAKNVIKGSLIVNRNKDRVFDIVVDIIKRWEDFKPMWDLYVDVSINGFGENR